MINNFPLINIYEQPKVNAGLSSQMLYGEKFKIINKKGNWLKIKTDYDKYTGYIQNKKFLIKFDPQFKISTVKSKIFINEKKKFRKTNRFLYFGSRITKINENKKFIEFEKNKWIKKKDLKKVNHFEKDHNKIFKLFLNSKYLWGGKTADGIWNLWLGWMKCCHGWVCEHLEVGALLQTLGPTNTTEILTLDGALIIYVTSGILLISAQYFTCVAK